MPAGKQVYMRAALGRPHLEAVHRGEVDALQGFLATPAAEGTPESRHLGLVWRQDCHCANLCCVMLEEACTPGGRLAQLHGSACPGSCRNRSWAQLATDPCFGIFPAAIRLIVYSRAPEADADQLRRLAPGSRVYRILGALALRVIFFDTFCFSNTYVIP